MERTNFEKLDVYRLSERVADEIWKVVIEWESFAKGTVGYQIVRAADSVGANIAEGLGRGTPQDHRRFIRMSRGSLNETKHWLRRAYSRHLLTREVVDKLKPPIDELGPKLNAYLRSIQGPSGKPLSANKPQPAMGNLQPTTYNPQPTTHDGPGTTNK